MGRAGRGCPEYVVHQPVLEESQRFAIDADSIARELFVELLEGQESFWGDLGLAEKHASGTSERPID